MNLVLRHPGLYLWLHWTVTLALAGMLLVPTLVGGGPGGGDRTVTLLTGQRVVIHPDGSLAPAPGLVEGQLPPSSPGGAEAQADGLAGDQFAYPAALAAAIGSFLDPHLFDVTYLAANGLDDGSSATVPLIVEFATHQQAAQAVQRGGVEGGIVLTHLYEYGPYASGYVARAGPFARIPCGATFRLEGLGVAANASVPVTFDNGRSSYPLYPLPNGAPTTGPAAQPASGCWWAVDSNGAWSADAVGVAKVFLDLPEQLPAGGPQQVDASMQEARQLIGVDAARQRGLTGQGVRVAVVDTGIDGSHPDLSGRVVAAQNFSSDGDTVDHFGHGTHVAGIIGGTGALSDGKYGGIAPAVLLINAKALGRTGSGSLSGIMKAMEWAADNGARIENMSLGAGESDGRDPLSREVDNITVQKGVLFVIAAGNAGPRRKVSTPAAADLGLAVGAIDKAREMAPWSSRGPRVGDMVLKPDLVAPGVSITSTRANFGPGNPYVAMSGTSMAAPMVAGAAALVLQLHPDWTPQQLKDALMSSADPIGERCQPDATCDGYVSAFDQGAGLVSLTAIVDQVAVASPGSLSYRTLKPREERSLTISLRNISDHALTVEIRASLRSDQGSPVPGVIPQYERLQLEPGATAGLDVAVTAPEAAGQYTGELVFSTGGTAIARAPLALVVS